MKEFRTKMRRNLIILLILAVVVIITAVISFMTIFQYPLISSLSIIIAIISVYFLTKTKSQFEYNRHQYQLNGLLEYKNKPFNIKKQILNNEFYRFLETKENYKHYRTDTIYTIYYKVSKGLTNKKTKTLYAILVLHSNVDFTSETTSNAFESLERYLYKKEKYHQRIFYQFKTTNSPLNNKVQTEADHIFFINDKKNNIILLNVILNPKTNKVYFLNSQKFKPSNFLSTSLVYLDNLINYK